MNHEPEEKFIPEGKPVTLDDLAAMVQRGFAETAKTADLDLLRADMNNGFERIEKILLTKQEERIAKLEKAMEKVKETLAL
ncbi:MAG: hypothetical protein HY268_17770 [Deltaproteobacteria bacterium]|nr:hypothetical protein [Deltaproteobacteria bacterium]